MKNLFLLLVILINLSFSSLGAERTQQSAEASTIWWALEGGFICRYDDINVEKTPLLYDPQSFIIGKIQNRTLLLTHEIIPAHNQHVLVAYLRLPTGGWKTLWKSEEGPGIAIQNISLQPVSFQKIYQQLRIVLTTSERKKTWIFNQKDCSFIHIPEEESLKIQKSHDDYLHSIKKIAPLQQVADVNIEISQGYPAVLIASNFVTQADLEALKKMGLFTFHSSFDIAGENVTASWLYCPLINESLLSAGFSKKWWLPENDPSIHHSFEELANKFPFYRITKSLIQYNLSHLPNGNFIYEEKGFRGFEQNTHRYPFSDLKHMENETQVLFLEHYSKFLPGVDYSNFFSNLAEGNDSNFSRFSASDRIKILDILKKWEKVMLIDPDTIFSLFSFIGEIGNLVQRQYIAPK